MAKKRSRASKPAVWRAPPDLTIYRAAELKAALLLSFQGAAALDIDLADVSEIDCAGIQLLMLAQRVAGRRQCALRMVGHSPAVSEAFALLNLDSCFADLAAPGA